MSEAFDLHRDHGLELHNEGRFEDALVEWQIARDLRPEDAWLRRSIGWVQSHLGQKEAAIAEFREAIRLQPDYEDAHQSLVHALFKTGHSDKALAAVRQALLVCPASSGLYRYLGVLLRDEANKTKDKLGWVAAVAAFQQSINLDPTHCGTLHSLGILHWKLGKKREAVAALKAAVGVEPNNVEAHMELVNYQVRTGDLRGAMHQFRTLCDLAETEEGKLYFDDPARCRSCYAFLLSLSAGIAAVFVGAWIWNRRRGR